MLHTLHAFIAISNSAFPHKLLLSKRHHSLMPLTNLMMVLCLLLRRHRNPMPMAHLLIALPL